MTLIMKKENAPRAVSRFSRLRAFTLTEIAIVLGIMGLILGAIWVAASSVYTNMRVSTTSRDVIAFSQGVRNLYGNQGSMDSGLASGGSSLSNYQALVQSGAVPSSWINGTNIVDTWGGSITFTPGTTANTSADSFVVDLDKVPQAACVGLLTDNSVRTSSSGIYGLNANNTTVFNSGSGVGTTTNYNAGAAVTQCTGTSNNHVGYAFTIH